MYYWEITFSILTPTLLSGVFMCTCHAGCKEVSTGDRFDGDTRLPLQEPRDKLGLHLLQSTRQRSFATAHSGCLSQWHIKSSTVLRPPPQRIFQQTSSKEVFFFFFKWFYVCSIFNLQPKSAVLCKMNWQLSVNVYCQ